MSPLRRLILVVVLGLPLVGCKQNMGERCQLDSDCNSGLFCVIPTNVTLAEGGTCQGVGVGVDLSGDFAGLDQTTQINGDLVLPSDMAATVLPDLNAPTDLRMTSDLSAVSDLRTVPDAVQLLDMTGPDSD